MTFKEIIAEVNCFLQALDTPTGSYTIFRGESFPQAMEDLRLAADEGRIVEVPLTGEHETVEIPDMDTTKMEKLKR